MYWTCSLSCGSVDTSLLSGTWHDEVLLAPGNAELLQDPPQLVLAVSLHLCFVAMSIMLSAFFVALQSLSRRWTGCISLTGTQQLWRRGLSGCLCFPLLFVFIFRCISLSEMPFGGRAISAPAGASDVVQILGSCFHLWLRVFFSELKNVLLHTAFTMKAYSKKSLWIFSTSVTCQGSVSTVLNGYASRPPHSSEKEVISKVFKEECQVSVDREEDTRIVKALI